MFLNPVNKVQRHTATASTLESRAQQLARLTPLLCAQVWALLLCLPVLSRMITPIGRYIHFITLGDVIMQCVYALLLGLALWIVGLALWETSRTWFCRIAPPLSYVTFAAITWRLGVFYNAESPTPLADHVTFGRYVLATSLVGALLVGLVAWRRWTARQVTQSVARISLCLSPLVPLFWFNAIRLPVYPAAPETAAPLLEHRSQPVPDENVFIFVFDAWPTRLTYDADQVVDRLPHLRGLSQTANLFTQAYSPGEKTLASMPLFLYQTGDPYGWIKYQPGFKKGNTFHASKVLPNMFTAARQQGYRTYMLGSYHAYHVMLGDSVGQITSTSYFDFFGDGWLDDAAEFYCMATTDVVGNTLSKYVFGSYALERNCSIARQMEILLAETGKMIASPGTGKFAVIHVPLPHYPFCYNEDGSLRPVLTEYDRESEELLRGHLAYTDKVLGNLLQQLKQTDQFDNSTIVVTADHNWRGDPQLVDGPAAMLRHVPLIVKMPGQSTGQVVTRDVSTTRLMKLMEYLSQPDGLQQIASDNSLAVPPRTPSE